MNLGKAALGGGVVVGADMAAANALYAAQRYAEAVGRALSDQAADNGFKALLLALLEACTAAGYRQILAVIGGAEPASAAVHASCGFVETGRMHAVGRKHGRWLDTVYMQRPLGEGDQSLPVAEFH